MNPADLNDAYKSMAAEALSALSAASVALLQSEDGKRVLARLKADQRGREALDAIVKTGEDLDNLLRACVQADLLMRTLPQRLKTEHEFARSPIQPRAKRSTIWSGSLTRSVSRPPIHLRRKVTIRPEYLVIVRGAFRVMRYVLELMPPCRSRNPGTAGGNPEVGGHYHGGRQNRRRECRHRLDCRGGGEHGRQTADAARCGFGRGRTRYR